MQIVYLSLLVVLVTGCGRQENPTKFEAQAPDILDVRLSQDLPKEIPTVVGGAAGERSDVASVVRVQAVGEPMEASVKALHDSNVPPEVLILDPVSIALNKANSRPREVSNGAWGECNLIINVLGLVAMERDNGLPSSVSERNVAKILEATYATDSEVQEWVSAARAVHASSVASRYVVDVLGDQCGKLTKG